MVIYFSWKLSTINKIKLFFKLQKKLYKRPKEEILKQTFFC